MSDYKKIGIVGVGKVGTAVGVLLKKAGYDIGFVTGTNLDRLSVSAGEIGEIEGLTFRYEVSSTSTRVKDADEGVFKDAVKNVDIVFITTPDMIIGDAVKGLIDVGGIRGGQLVVHMSGSLTSDVLAPARDSGAYVASLHPLQSFADFQKAVLNIPGSVFCLEGDPETTDELKKIIAHLDGVELEIPKEKKSLYHAGAVVASNYLVSLIWAALTFYENIGMDQKTAISALMPLIEGTLKNINSLGAPRALTGPIARGDWQTVSEHIKAMEKELPALLDFYRTMGRLTVRAAETNETISEEIAKKLNEVLE